MNTKRWKVGGYLTLAALLVFASASVEASWVQAVSRLIPGQTPPAGGNGDSCLPILSRDGRFLLFASTANNLVVTSNNMPMPVAAPAHLNVFLRDRLNQTTALVSADGSGLGGGNGNSFPLATTTNGQFALFESDASNLTPDDTNHVTDVFLRDLSSGATPSVSAGTNGRPGNGPSRGAVMTPDGRYVAFSSEASDLVAGDTNQIADIFVRDMQTHTTALVSAGARIPPPAPNQPASTCESPEITPDGRKVAFFSTAAGLVATAGGVGDIYVRDLVTETTTWASSGMRDKLKSVTGKTNGVCYNLALSDGGRFIAYQASLTTPAAGTYSGIILRYDLDTDITDLIHTNVPTSISVAEQTRNLDLTSDGERVAFVANSNGLGAGTTCILLWDAATRTPMLVSEDGAGSIATNTISTHPVLDSTGRYVAFISNAPGLATNAVPGVWHVYLRDLQAGTAMLVDVDTNATAAGVTAATVPALSADGRFIAFESADGQLVPDDTNLQLDVSVRDMVAGATELTSICHPDLVSTTPNNLSTLSEFSSSADGQFIAFASMAGNLVAGDTNGGLNVFVRDMASGSSVLVSADSAGKPGNGLSCEPSISADGRFIAFGSSATNLVADDTNRLDDIFVRDVLSGRTTLASRRLNGKPGSQASAAPSLSSDGRWLLFQSRDSLAAEFTGPNYNLFLRDLQLGTNWALTYYSFNAASMTPDGHFAAFVGRLAGGFGPLNLYVWDTGLCRRLITNSVNDAYGVAVAISRDGNRIASVTSTQMLFLDRSANVTWGVPAASPSTWTSPSFSIDGRWLAYARRAPSTNQVFLRDLDSGVELLVSHAWDSDEPGAGGSDSPVISPDGRFVAYRTLATNLVVGAVSPLRQIVLYDRQTGANTLVTANRLDGRSANERSQRARFSADGQTLLVQSWASDLLGGDLNRSGDVFAYPILTAVVLPPNTPGQGPLLSWPVLPGSTSRAQYKDSLDDSTWQDLPGSVTNAGVKLWQQDNTATNAQRFYRVIAF